MTWNLMSKPGHRALRLQPVREAQGLTEQLTPAGTAPWVRRLFLIQSLHLGAFLPFPSPLWTWCFHLEGVARMNSVDPRRKLRTLRPVALSSHHDQWRPAP